LKQIFEICFGYHGGISISVLLGCGAISGIVTLFATIVTLDCFQMVAVVIIASSVVPSMTSNATPVANIASADATAIVGVSDSLIMFALAII
jgi:hypothetical protein